MPSTIFSQIRRRPRRRRRKRVRKRTLALGSIRARCAADRGSDQHVSHGYMHCLRRELVHLTHTLTSAVRLGVSQARTADTAMTIINLSPRRFAARAHAVPTASGASRRPAAVPAACARTTADARRGVTSHALGASTSAPRLVARLLGARSARRARAPFSHRAFTKYAADDGLDGVRAAASASDAGVAPDDDDALKKTNADKNAFVRVREESASAAGELLRASRELALLAMLRDATRGASGRSRRRRAPPPCSRTRTGSRSNGTCS